jgi:hypothetical protein
MRDGIVVVVATGRYRTTRDENTYVEPFFIAWRRVVRRHDGGVVFGVWW